MLCVRRTLREVAAGPKSGFQMNLAQLSASGGFLHLKPLGHWHRTGTTMGDKKGGSWMKTTQNGTQSVACSQDSNYLVFFVFEVWFAPLWGQPRHAHNRLETVVEKEIKQSPQQRMSAEGMDPNSMEASGLAAQGSHLGGWRWIDVDWCRLMSIDVDWCRLMSIVEKNWWGLMWRMRIGRWIVEVLAIKHTNRKPQEKWRAKFGQVFLELFLLQVDRYITMSLCHELWSNERHEDSPNTSGKFQSQISWNIKSHENSDSN